MHDLVIRNALLLDGLGGTPFHGDLAVAGGRIAGLGQDLGAARATLDALRRQRNELAEWYGGLKHSSAESWEQVKAGFVKSYEVLRESFAKARKEF